MATLQALILLGYLALWLWMGTASGLWAEAAVGATFGLLAWIAPWFACAELAARKGRSRWKWFMLGAVFSWLAAALLLVLPPTSHAITRRARDWFLGPEP